MSAMSERSWKHLLAALGVKPDQRGGLPDRLTENIIERARITSLGFEYRLRDGKVPGLALHVGKNCNTSWWLAYKSQDDTRHMYRLGSGDTFNVASARRKAEEIRVAVQKGQNPAAEKVEQRKEEAEAKEAEAAKAKNTLRAFVLGAYWKKLSHHKSGEADKRRLLNAWGPLLDKPLVEITSEDIEDHLQVRKDDGYAAGTLHRDWAALSSCLREAIEQKKVTKLERMPTTRRPKPLKGFKPNHRTEYLDRVEGHRARLAQALKAAEKHIDEGHNRMLLFFVKLSAATGMRRSEILGLRQGEIGADSITLPAHRTKTNEVGTIHLNAEAKEALKLWKVRDSRTGEFFPGYLDERGFPGPQYDRLGARLSHAWRALIAEAKLADFHAHDLRHSFASALRLAHVSIEVVQKALRHKHIASTMRYAHVSDKEVEAAVSNLPTLGL